MAVITSVVYVDYLPSKFRSLPGTTATAKINSPPPILISTNPLHLNPNNLKELYTLCQHSCHRFPTVDDAGRVEPVDLLKLRTAISHSSIVVSVFTKPEFLEPQSSISNGIGGEWIRNLAPVTLENGELIGFGRAVTDMALTASIYDVMVHPTLQGRGIGRMIVQRIIRMLTNRDIYDIAALCTNKERLFFKACGFGDDMLGSTTMMYTRPPSGYSKDEQMISAELRYPSAAERGFNQTSMTFVIQFQKKGKNIPFYRIQLVRRGLILRIIMVALTLLLDMDLYNLNKVHVLRHIFFKV